MYTYTPANSISDGPITTVFNAVQFVKKKKSFYLSCERGERLNDFRFGTLIGRFRSDGAASMSVKGLRSTAKERLFRSSRN